MTAYNEAKMIKTLIGKLKHGSDLLEQLTEITSLIGNISLRDDEPMVHAHLTLADSDGTSYGGHLQPGTIVFAGEFIIDACEGSQLSRSFDDQTGLALWKI